MVRFEWKPEYSVENDGVDNDHQGFFTLAQELVDSQPTPDLFSDVLDRLEQYATGHFAREEALMELIRYPQLDEHVKSHRAFSDWLADITKSYHSPSADQMEVGKNIIEFVETWLVQHILKEDMLYRDYMMSNY